MTERTTGNARELHFSIDGKFVANHARDKLFLEDDFVAAMELILHATVTDQLSEAERVATALAILDQLEICRDVMTESQLIQCDQEWRASRGEGTIFDACDELDDVRTSVVASFLKQQTDGPDDPYGWLFPDGTFHPVEWGGHQSWAHEWLEDHDPAYETSGVPRHMAGDYLNERHRAVLLHDPAMGVAHVTNSAGHPLTKAQKEFLFDYYAGMGLDDEASAIYED